MPSTARAHFDDDFSRAVAICQAAEKQKREPLRSDLARSAVVFAVGALDAYLCDAFVDSLARTMKACRRNGSVLPPGYAKLSIPAGPLLSSYKARPNWGLRMAARSMMEKDNLLQVRRVKGLINPVLPKSCELWEDVALAYIAVGRKRLTGISPAEFAKVPAAKRPGAQRKAASHLLDRIEGIVQRRHDIAHNCDRPKNAPRPLKAGTARNMLADISAFVTILDNYVDAHRLY